MEFFPHRIESATNFAGTLTHELAHLIQSQFEGEWKKNSSGLIVLIIEKNGK